MRLSRYQRLDNQVVYASEYHVGVDSVLLQKLFESSQTPFVAYVIPLCIYVFDLIG